MWPTIEQLDGIASSARARMRVAHRHADVGVSKQLLNCFERKCLAQPVVTA
jgi:hypothetical protein